ncbi:MAG: HAMP domain-containing sensor histidine kinase [Bacteroidota bacterium]|nr:HAMP domain-containing sensor histidine kinase [Bacteroidota bacterium]MDP4204553.1 HAMP domain-containing sensor histidine kinase [Bacteroidota bacterium]
MNSKAHRRVIILAAISILGVILIQFFFLKLSLNNEEKNFHRTVSNSLKIVAEKMVDYNNRLYRQKRDTALFHPVDRMSNNYYVVNVGDVIDPYVLEYYLRQEFSKQRLETDYEFGVYDCESNNMKYGAYVNVRNKAFRLGKDNELPKCDKYIYYFGVFFPHRTAGFTSEIRLWALFSAILAAVILFFAYSLFLIFRQRRLSEIQKNFINNMTHELKTPVTSIAISSKVLSDPHIIEEPERMSEYVKIITMQSQRLEKLIEQVLQMAAADKGKIELAPNKVNIDLFITDVVENFRVLHPETSLIYTKKDGIADPFIDADKMHFSHAIGNLLDNAVKYCSTNPVIHITLTSDEKNFLISVADNGIGIDPKFHKLIFKKFFRVPTGDIHNVKGFGLGLDYVYKVCNLHGWKITLQSQVGIGSVFTIKIPIHGKKRI